MGPGGPQAMSPRRWPGRRSPRWRSPWSLRPGPGASRLPGAWPLPATATTRPSCRASTTARSPTWWAAAAPVTSACPPRGAPRRSCCRRVRAGVASPRSRAPRCVLRPGRSSRSGQRTAGRPSPGGRTPTGFSAHSSWPCACTGPPAAPHAPPALTASARDRRAGCVASAPCQAHTATARGPSDPCQRTRHATASLRWPTAAGPSRQAMRTPRAHGAWTTTRAGVGMGCIGIGHG